jgi:type VII secretion-associated serine protease mycosin
MSAMARRFWRAAAVAGLAAAAGLGVPAGAARAATGGYTPSGYEWWLANWKVPQKVWPLSEGAGVTVAVLDSGVQAGQPDLRGVVLPGEDELGYSGDGEQDYAPDGGHGTEVAALIAGQGYGIGDVVGIAPKAKILPVHVLDPSSDMTPVPNGIIWAVNHGANIINMSIGAAVPTPTFCTPAEQQAISYALAHNVVVVAASGDVSKTGGRPVEPATCAGVLAVGGVEPDGSLWQGSAQGSNVSVAAPGDHMEIPSSNGREYSTMANGTSLSAPLVAGAAALIRSRYPSMPWYQVDQRLIGTALPAGSPVPNNGYGYGIIDVFRAVDVSAYPVPASSPDPPYTRYMAWLQSAAGQAWAQQNGVRVPGASPSGAPPAAANPSPGSGRTGDLVIVLVVVVAVAVAAGVLAVVLRSRRRSGRGPGVPGRTYRGPGPVTQPGPVNFPPPAYPPTAYGPPQGQYPPGQYPPGQYPPGQYPPQGQSGAYWRPGEQQQP